MKRFIAILLFVTGLAGDGFAATATGVGGGTTLTDSASLRTALSDETGTGAAVFANTPTLVNPILGTPQSGNLSQCTAYPVTSIQGMGSNVSGFLVTPNSAGLALALTDETGTGAMVFGTSPTFTTSITLPNNATAMQNVAETNSCFGFALGSPVIQKAGTRVAQFQSSGALFLSSITISGSIGGTDDTVLTRATTAVVGVEGASSVGGAMRFTAKTATQITSNQNDYNPGGRSKFQRWSSDASRNVTGLVFASAGVDGEEHLIVNVGSQSIVLSNESASSTAANRFTNSTGADITLSANQAADLIYDGTTSRWRVFKRN
jgi:hypothetical protein